MGNGNVEALAQETWADLDREDSLTHGVFGGLLGSSRISLVEISEKRGLKPAQVINALAGKNYAALADLLHIPHDDRRAPEAVMQHIFRAGDSVFEGTRSRAYTLLNNNE